MKTENAQKLKKLISKQPERRKWLMEQLVSGLSPKIVLNRYVKAYKIPESTAKAYVTMAVNKLQPVMPIGVKKEIISRGIKQKIYRINARLKPSGLKLVLLDKAA